MSKLNLDLPILLIDTSYWLYYRFFSLRNWYYRAYPEKYNNYNNDKNSFNADYNWFEDEVFMTKYKKLFIENIKKICKKFNTKLENVVFCIDCPHNEIWRKTYITNLNKEIDTNNKTIINKNDNDNKNETHKQQEQVQELIQDYKGTRLESHKKNRFNSFNIFNYMKTTFLPILKDNIGAPLKIMSCSQCEADDIIGHLTLYIQTLKRETKPIIYILANDNDYLQICNNKVKLINGVGKIISVSHSGNSNSNDNSNCNSNSNSNTIGDNYLLSKILLGDKSDNIKCCVVNMGYICSGIPNSNFKNVGKSCISKIFNNKELLKVFYDLLISIRNNTINGSDNNSDVGSFSGDDINKIIDINKFKHNCIMMDFKMIPLELKQTLYSLFNQFI